MAEREAILRVTEIRGDDMEMMKLVINRCHGGFALSKKAQHYLDCNDVGDWDYRLAGNRAAPQLVEVVESLGEEASDYYSNLQVVEIPKGEYQYDWVIKSMMGLKQ